MKTTLLAVMLILGAMFSFSTRGVVASPLEPNQSMFSAWDDDDDEEEWSCSCSVTCDDTKLTVKEKVCADDEDLQEAMQDAVDACARDADSRCEDEPVCKCKCTPTNKAC